MRWIVPQLLMVALFANLALIMNPVYQWLLVAQLAALVVACWAYG